MMGAFKKLLGLALVAGGAYALLVMNGVLMRLADTDTCTEATAVESSVITFTDTAVTPACAVVASGTRVTWANASDGLVQVGSDSHPVHSDNSEISEGQFVLQLDPGESTTVTLVTKGTFGFHDHVKPTLTGKVLVK